MAAGLPVMHKAPFSNAKGMAVVARRGRARGRADMRQEQMRLGVVCQLLEVGI